MFSLINEVYILEMQLFFRENESALNWINFNNIQQAFKSKSAYLRPLPFSKNFQIALFKRYLKSIVSRLIINNWLRVFEDYYNSP